MTGPTSRHHTWPLTPRSQNYARNSGNYSQECPYLGIFPIMIKLCRLIIDDIVLLAYIHKERER